MQPEYCDYVNMMLIVRRTLPALQYALTKCACASAADKISVTFIHSFENMLKQKKTLYFSFANTV